MTSRRGTSNSNSRGGASDRRSRKQWLLDTFGDGTTAPCFNCNDPVTFTTITVDRIVPGVLGGKYVRGNIRPCCGHCNSVLGAQLARALKACGLSKPRREPAPVL